VLSTEEYTLSHTHKTLTGMRWDSRIAIITMANLHDSEEVNTSQAFVLQKPASAKV
jgi:hypothetical protein